MHQQSHPEVLLRAPQVLKRLPICRSAWWLGVKEGKYPAGIKLSPRVTVWRESDVDALIARLWAGESAMNTCRSGATLVSDASGPRAADSGNAATASATASVVARLAMRGFVLAEIEGGAFLVSRWGGIRHCPDLKTLTAFAEQVGARP
jgi:prophage regulatory protein